MPKKNQNQSPLYATLLYDVRKQLDISLNEYFYLDMVYHLSYDSWCYKSLENCAEDIGITKQGLINIRKKLVKRGLLKLNIKGYAKVTDKYTSVAVNKVYPVGKESLPKNNNRITENNNDNYKKARIASNKIRKQLQERFSLS